jgi:hypothetical protein
VEERVVKGLYVKIEKSERRQKDGRGGKLSLFLYLTRSNPLQRIVGEEFSKEVEGLWGCGVEDSFEGLLGGLFELYKVVQFRMPLCGLCVIFFNFSVHRVYVLKREKSYTPAIPLR